MLNSLPNHKDVYDSFLIGSKIRLEGKGNHFVEGILMDKYLTDSNVFVDIILNNETIIEHYNVFVNDKQIVTLA